jgi:glycine/serine hydroxymethyltransferase
VIVFLRRKEAHNDRYKRIHLLTDRKDYGLCPSAMDAQVAVHELAKYLLGDDWHIVMPVSPRQANTEIVFAIEEKYKRAKS